MQITKETTMGQMLEYDQGIAYILWKQRNPRFPSLLTQPGEMKIHREFLIFLQNIR